MITKDRCYDLGQVMIFSFDLAKIKAKVGDLVWSQRKKCDLVYQRCNKEMREQLEKDSLMLWTRFYPSKFSILHAEEPPPIFCPIWNFLCSSLRKKAKNQLSQNLITSKAFEPHENNPQLQKWGNKRWTKSFKFWPSFSYIFRQCV